LIVSGFLISPKDQLRIRSGEASETLISSKTFCGVSGLKGLLVRSSGAGVRGRGAGNRIF
jgi:hypothetical protein